MSHPPLPRQSRLPGHFTQRESFCTRKRRHREQRRRLSNIYSSTTGNETRTANPAPQSDTAVSVRPRSRDLAREVEPHAGGLVLLMAGVPGEAFFKHIRQVARAHARAIVADGQGRLPYRRFPWKKFSTGFSSAYFTLLLTTCPSRKHSPRRSENTVSSASRSSTRKCFSSSSGR